MKIAGVILNIEDAKEIEDIVKVFVIKERISDLLPSRKNKNKKITNAMEISRKYDNKLIENYKINTSSKDTNNLHLPLFNFRGLS